MMLFETLVSVLDIPVGQLVIIFRQGLKENGLIVVFVIKLIIECRFLGCLFPFQVNLVENVGNLFLIGLHI